MRRKTGPVQQWVDSIPSPTKTAPDTRTELDGNGTPPLTPVFSKENIFVKPTMTISSPITVPSSPIVSKTSASSPIAHNRLARDPSFQSDDSHCSSVESLLELRRADPEAVLLGLGFGGSSGNSKESGPLSRIPKRFLQPSKLQGITINDFVKHEQETNESLDSASLGYRGLTGSPYVAPSEIVQKIMERLRDHESHEQDAYTLHNNNTEPYNPIFQDTSRLSVLSPDNRQFLSRPRSKSPDMRNKRMIIGEKSFAFGHDGDLIELDISNDRDSDNSSTNGNADNHETELDDKFISDEESFNNNPKTTKPDESKSISAMSKIQSENRDSSELPMGDKERVLISPNCDFRPDELYARHRGDFGESTSCGISEKHENTKPTREDESGEDQPLNERRSSCDVGEMKNIPWSRLSRDAGRRYSDGSFKPGKCSSNVRKSLKRQSRISDAEAIRYCQFYSSSNHDTLDEDEKTDVAKSNVDITENPPKAEFEGNETDRRSIRSDRLSTTNVEKSLESSVEKKSIESINVPEEIDDPVGAVRIESSSTNRSRKKRPGLSTILGMYNSAMNVRMEPGF